ncbi:hypothetical protein J6590_020324 [Homalodisca vitripennis]|nr:hypothetical protein J6590_020324 [Homalodisca vitripennis]
MRSSEPAELQTTHPRNMAMACGETRPVSASTLARPRHCTGNTKTGKQQMPVVKIKNATNQLSLGRQWQAAWHGLVVAA